MKFNPFKKKVFNTNSIICSADRLITVDDYVPNPDEGHPYVARVNNVNIFRPFDPNKSVTAPKALYAVANISRNADTLDFIRQYGDKLIIVSDRFCKLGKKAQSIIVQKACYEIADIPDRFTSGMDNVDSTSLDREVAVKLQLIEKFGYCTIKRALNKENRINIKGTAKAGRYLYKISRQNAKTIAKSNKVAQSNGEGLKKPVIFKNVEVAPNN